ncbi:PH domain-containing protein [Salinispora tropica]|uniref:Membrane-flanked domain n=1 Tax=Salinispora tropica (strain ATCC BAA-916 / DSM 44818 / JCM 13857 / NBRC 105044 / CNB-440) TaxID=369723 RepID=A4X385_SALTO|nr:PH domain-containing protein [Salinispora tropica]ABP53335.1 membrane-flanked domain [Salinispora tropica CNB-440]
MAFPEDVLTEDEHVVLHLHPHWKNLVRPVVVTILAVAVVVAALVLAPDGAGRAVVLVVLGGLALVGVLWFALWPVLVWQATHYLFTTERVLIQRGALSRGRRDIPLTRVTDHAIEQRFSERLLGCGTLTIDSAGERGQSVLFDVPQVGRVQTTLYELVEAQHDRQPPGDAERREALTEVPDGRPQREPG